MKIVRFHLGQLQANCYLLIKDDRCLIIDPADEASFILEEIQRRKLTLVALLITHGHFDHIMAAGEIQWSFRVPFYIFKEDVFLVNRLKETARYYLSYNSRLLKPTNFKFLKEGDLKIGDWKFKIIFTPGHTPGSGCFYFRQENVIFTGDTLFRKGIGRHDFSYSNKELLQKSLKKLSWFKENIQK